MSAAAEVHMCISGDGDEGEEDGGEGEKYDYDYGGEMELIMDDEQAKVCNETRHRAVGGHGSLF